MTPPSFSELISRGDPISTNEVGFTITKNWLQGRTTYGGLSAALCLAAVEKNHTELPPLRSAQISFVGPVAGDVRVTTDVVRQGRSVAYIQATMSSDAGPATVALFCFGQSRPSRLDKDFTVAPKVASEEHSEDFFNAGFGPAFANNYDCKLASGGHPISGSAHHEHYLWVRHKDPNACGMTALLGIADMPPPAVLPMFEEFAPISSMTWMVNVLRQDLATKDGWWLLRSAAEHAREGYSSQDMQVWNSSGDLVISAMQNVALFY